MLRGNELAAVRQSALFTLPDRCTVSRYVWVETAGGGFSGGDIPTTIASNVPCRIGPAGHGGSALEVVANQVEPDSLALISLPHDTDVKAGDVITVVGAKYPVLGVAERSEQVTFLKRVTVECQ